jgi:hypothetical protein
MARSLNIVIGADIEKLRKGLQDAITAIQSSGNKMSAETAKAASAIENKLAEISKKNPTAGTVRQLTNLAMEARALGPEFAQTANDIIRAAGKMKDSIGDARAEVSYFASDTRRLDAVLGGVNAIAGAFGAVEGALAITGMESEDLQKVMVKLQGAIALVNGVTAIQAALQQESAVMQGVLSAATEVQTFVMGQATLAARAYSAALIATGAGAVIVAIGLVITLFQKSAKAIDEAKERLAALEQQQERGLTLGQRRIKAEERALELAISRAKAEGKTEAYIFNLKKASLEKQKAIYIQYGNEALDRLYAQRREEMYLADGNGKKIAEISAKYAQLENDLRYNINEEYRAKEVALEIEKNEAIDSQRKENLKNLKKNLDDEITAEELAAARISYIKSQGIVTKVQNNERQGLKPYNIAPVDPKAPKQLEHTFAQIDYAFQNQLKKQEEYEERFASAMEGINQAFNSLTAEGLESFGELIGGLMTGQIDSVDQFGKAMLQSVAKFMRAFGSALVATATASKAFKELILKNPLAAAAAGVALIAGSAIITGMLNKGPQPTAFAEGGIVSGPTLGLVGEYPNARTNPEVIAPLDKLKGMLKTNEQSGYIASTSINGRDLAIVLERYNKDSKRG